MKKGGAIYSHILFGLVMMIFIPVFIFTCYVMSPNLKGLINPVVDGGVYDVQVKDLEANGRLIYGAKISYQYEHQGQTQLGTELIGELMCEDVADNLNQYIVGKLPIDSKSGRKWTVGFAFVFFFMAYCLFLTICFLLQPIISRKKIFGAYTLTGYFLYFKNPRHNFLLIGIMCILLFLSVKNSSYFFNSQYGKVDGTVVETQSENVIRDLSIYQVVSDYFVQGQKHSNVYKRYFCEEQPNIKKGDLITLDYNKNNPDESKPSFGLDWLQFFLALFLGYLVFYSLYNFVLGGSNFAKSGSPAVAFFDVKRSDEKLSYVCRPLIHYYVFAAIIIVLLLIALGVPLYLLPLPLLLLLVLFIKRRKEVFYFDKREGIYVGKQKVELDKIQAVEMLDLRNMADERETYKKSLRYELNLILKDQTKVNVKAEPLPCTLEFLAKEIGDFLGVPVK